MTDLLDLLDGGDADTAADELPRSGSVLTDVSTWFPDNPTACQLTVDHEKHNGMSHRKRVDLVREELLACGVPVARALEFTGYYDRSGRGTSMKVCVKDDDMPERERLDLLRMVQANLHTQHLPAIGTYELKLVIPSDNRTKPLSLSELHVIELAADQASDPKMTPEQIAEWLDAGITDYRFWHRNQIDLDDACAWIQLMSVWHVMHWKDVDIATARPWVTASKWLQSRPTADAFKAAGYSPAQAAAWVDTNSACRHPDAIAQWAQIGAVTPADVLEWCVLDGMTASDAISFYAAGLTPDNLKPLRAAGHRPADVRKVLAEAARSKKLTLADLLNWARVGPGRCHAQARAKFIRAGLDVDAVLAWQQVLGRNVTVGQIAYAISRGVSPDATAEWVALHDRFRDGAVIGEWTAAGQTAADAAPWAAAMPDDASGMGDFTSYHVVEMWKDAHPLLADPQRAAAAVQVGATPAVAAEMLKLAAEWRP